MAAADTARLIAALELQDRFSRPLGGAERALGGFDRRLGAVQRSTRGLGVAGVAVGTALGNIGARLISGGFRGIVGAVGSGVEALNELQNVTVATNTVLESTQGVSGQTAESVRNLAEKYESLNATIDDKVIQAGENMLLTFTNVRKDAFEPALSAALDLNEALGRGEEGLQSTIIQVGKALNDPIRGLTALRRVGVNFTADQEKQIKALVASNDLYGAQQVILEELGTEFGGRFAAAGDTAEGSQARLRDTVEDLQKKLAGPLIPAIDRVRDKLGDFLSSPAALAGAEKLGDAIAGLFTDERLDAGVELLESAIEKLSSADFSGLGSTLGTIASTVGGLPWGAIGDAAKLLGTGSKALLDAFLGLPPWVQTAVLTGWGLNKLTGGALGGIVGELGKGLVKGVLGMNAGVVNINAATVNGPGGGLPGGGKPPVGAPPLFPGGLLGTALPLGVLAGMLAAPFIFRGPAAPEGSVANPNTTRIPLKDGGVAVVPAGTAQQWTALMPSFPSHIDTTDQEARAAIERSSVTASSLTGRWTAEARAAYAGIQGKLGQSSSAARSWNAEQRAAFARLNETGGRHIAKTQSLLDTVRPQTGLLAQIRDKKANITIKNTIPVNLSVNATVIQQRIERAVQYNGYDLTPGI